MTRYRFREGKTYAARLMRVSERPVENARRAGFRLLRLEFEFFEMRRDAKTLASTGKIASRDLIVGPLVDPSRDSHLTNYIAALHLKNPQTVKSWLALTEETRWLKVTLTRR